MAVLDIFMAVLKPLYGGLNHLHGGVEIFFVALLKHLHGGIELFFFLALLKHVHGGVGHGFLFKSNYLAVKRDRMMPVAMAALSDSARP